LDGREEIGVLLVPPIHCAPAWLVEKEPEILIVNEEDIRLEFGSRHTFCINHPTLLSLGVSRIIAVGGWAICTIQPTRRWL
jgi:beta-galactosidase